jgi:hypothetical protein
MTLVSSLWDMFRAVLRRHKLAHKLVTLVRYGRRTAAQSRTIEIGDAYRIHLSSSTKQNSSLGDNDFYLVEKSPYFTGVSPRRYSRMFVNLLPRDLNSVGSFLDLSETDGLTSFLARLAGVANVEAFSSRAKAKARLDHNFRAYPTLGLKRLEAIPKKQFDCICYNLLRYPSLATLTEISSLVRDHGSLLVAGCTERHELKLTATLVECGFAKTALRKTNEYLIVRYGATRLTPHD